MDTKALVRDSGNTESLAKQTSLAPTTMKQKIVRRQVVVDNEGLKSETAVLSLGDI